MVLIEGYLPASHFVTAGRFFDPYQTAAALSITEEREARRKGGDEG